MFPYKATFPSMDDPSSLTQTSFGGDNQWLSQSAYQNIDLEKVDWAVLAQQWIHMKTNEPGDSLQIPNAPPPPRISKSETMQKFEDEQGEAPMEMDLEDEHPQEPNAPPPPTNIFNANNWIGGNSSDRSQMPNKQWQKKPNRWNQSNPSNSNQMKTHQMHRAPNDDYIQQAHNIRQSSTNNAWPVASTTTTTTTATPPPPISMQNAPFSHANIEFQSHGMDTNLKSSIQLENIDLNTAPPLDAAQRKTLPAWIREGLEKMEREKFKQAERDREMKERDEKRKQDKLTEQNLLMQLNAVDAPSAMIHIKSKFDSDSESDAEDRVNSEYSEKLVKTAKTTIAASMPKTATPTMVGSNSSTTSTSSVPMLKPHRSKADILTEIMLSVRKNLTEILLEVTNEEIFAIAQDTLSKMRFKGRKAQTVQKNALTAITPALGLVTYDDSDRSDGESDAGNDSERERNASDVDSEYELKKTIQRRKLAFEEKSTEIEIYLAENEEKEKQWLEDDNDQSKLDEMNQLDDQSSSSTSNASLQQQQQLKNIDSGEIQHDKNKLSTGAQKPERKGSRFSDAKGFIFNVGSSQLESSVSNQSAVLKTMDRQLSGGKDSKSNESKKEKHRNHESESSYKNSKSSRNKHRRDRSRSSDKRHKRSKRRRSSSSSSNRSSYSRNSNIEKSRKKRSHRDRSSSDDRTSKSSRTSSYKSDKHSRENSSRSEYKKSRKSRSRSHDRHSSPRRHR